MLSAGTDQGMNRHGTRRDERENLQRLLDVSKAICSILDLDELLEVVMEKVMEVTGAGRGLLMLHDATGELRVRVAKNFEGSGPADRISGSVATQVARTGVPVCATNVEEHEDVRCRKSVLELGLLSVMCVPLTIRNRILGVIYVDSKRVSALFSSSSLPVFSSLAEHAAVAIENATLYELAITDSKTGLYNHSYFMRRLEESAGRFVRYRRPFGLLMIDIDHFKSINDGYGHRAGDQVLVDMGGLLRRSVRSSDIAARFGGEEFAVLLSEVEQGGEPPRLTADRLRRAVEDHRTPWEGGEIRITISVGVSVADGDSVVTGEELVESADRELYRAKQSGRNRVCGGAKPRLSGVPPKEGRAADAGAKGHDEGRPGGA